jgi:hypothetical protein
MPPIGPNGWKEIACGRSREFTRQRKSRSTRNNWIGPAGLDSKLRIWGKEFASLRARQPIQRLDGTRAIRAWFGLHADQRRNPIDSFVMKSGNAAVSRRQFTTAVSSARITRERSRTVCSRNAVAMAEYFSPRGRYMLYPIAMGGSNGRNFMPTLSELCTDR